MKILVTGGNAPGTNGTCWSLLQSGLFDSQVELIGADNIPGISNNYFSKIFTLPLASEPNYLQSLNELSEKESVDLIVPQTSAETLLLGAVEAETIFGEVLLIQPRNLIKKLSSKTSTFQAIKDMKIIKQNYQICFNLDEVQSFIRDNTQSDFFLKATDLSGGRGIVKVVGNISSFLRDKPKSYHTIPISEVKNALRLLGTDNGVIIQQSSEGIEYSIDCYRDEFFNIAIPRKRDLIRAGISQTTTTVEVKSLIEFANKFADHFGIEGVFGLQCIIDQNGEITFLECNPRIQGSMVTSTIAGENLIGRAARRVMKLPPMPQKSISWGARFQRSWSGVGEVDEKSYLI